MITKGEYSLLLERVLPTRNSRGILSYDYSDLFHFFKDDIFFKDKVLEIYKLDDIQKIRKALMTLAQLVFWEESRSRSGDRINFKPTLLQNTFLEYMYRTDRLERKRVPLEEWIDIAKADLDLLKDLLEEGNLEAFENDPRYIKNSEMFFKRHEELRLSGNYDDLDDVMGD